jgi:hypothetical protein
MNYCVQIWGQMDRYQRKRTRENPHPAQFRVYEYLSETGSFVVICIYTLIAELFHLLMRIFESEKDDKCNGPIAQITDIYKHMKK